jgi:hypothetical protein
MAIVVTGARSASEVDSRLHARSIPTFGIRGQGEQERDVTSCPPAAMHGVPDFEDFLLRESSVPKASGIDIVTSDEVET